LRLSCIPRSKVVFFTALKKTCWGLNRKGTGVGQGGAGQGSREMPRSMTRSPKGRRQLVRARICNPLRCFFPLSGWGDPAHEELRVRNLAPTGLWSPDNNWGICDLHTWMRSINKQLGATLVPMGGAKLRADQPPRYSKHVPKPGAGGRKTSPLTECNLLATLVPFSWHQNSGPSKDTQDGKNFGRIEY